MAKCNFFVDEYRPHYEANIWIYNGKGDPLLLEKFTTRREALACINQFRKNYKGGEKLDCFINHFDEDECVDNSWNV
jgi:hypothetical protein